MTSKHKLKLFLVDDDAVFLKLLEIELREQADFDIETYATGELCIENLSNNPDIIILDYHLNGIHKDTMNGIETLDNIKAINPLIPVVMLSAQSDIDVAINCINHKAFDYVIKSEITLFRLKKTIIPFLTAKK